MKNLHKLLSSLEAASKHKFTLIKIPYNKKWKPILQILYNEGYIQNYFIQNKILVIYLRYYNKICCIRQIRLFLKLATYIFIKKKNLWLFERQQGTLILSTIHGIQTHHYCLKKNIGGKILFYIA